MQIYQCFSQWLLQLSPSTLYCPPAVLLLKCWQIYSFLFCRQHGCRRHGYCGNFQFQLFFSASPCTALPHSWQTQERELGLFIASNVCVEIVKQLCQIVNAVLALLVFDQFSLLGINFYLPTQQLQEKVTQTWNQVDTFFTLCLNMFPSAYILTGRDFNDQALYELQVSVPVLLKK